MIEHIRIDPGTKPKLAKRDGGDKLGLGGKEHALGLLAVSRQKLEKLQQRLYAEGKHSVLLVLQGLDASGKDGVIRTVFEGVNPQSCEVASFKAPTSTELAHDYLWRVHPGVPAKGQISIFDRSHYEQVLVVRVMGLEPKSRWREHYDEINAFERLLVDDGTTVLKFFLMIDRDEQRQRLQARIDDRRKRWKFRMGDLDTRKHWDDYIAAYEDALSKCSTEAAPWYVIPANHKWFRNLAVARIVAETLEELRPRFPPPAETIPPDLKVE